MAQRFITFLPVPSLSPAKNMGQDISRLEETSSDHIPGEYPYPDPLSPISLSFSSSSQISLPSSIDEEELVEIEQETIRLERLIVQHKEDITFLHYRRNALCCSTRALPPEILSLIFQYSAAPSSSYTHFPHLAKLGAVCALWRKIIWSTPSFWTTTKLDLRRRRSWPRQAKILQLYLQNSSPVGLALSLYCPLVLRESGRNPFFDVLFHKGNSNKIREIEAFRFPRSWLSSFSPNFDNLECLTLEGISNPDPSLQVNSWNLRLGVLPKLRQLNLFEATHTMMIPNADTIKVARIHGTESSAYRNIIQCPNVEELDLNISRKDNLADSPLLGSSPITIQNLKTLTWSIRAYQKTNVLKMLQLPMLENFNLSFGDDPDCQHQPDQDNIVALIQFIDRLPSLKTLEILRGRWNEASSVFLEHLFASFSALEVQELYLSQCDSETNIQLLEMLNTRTGPVYLPKLNLLSIMGDGGEDIVQALEGMLSSRRGRMDRTFLLRIHKDGWYSKDMGLLERMIRRLEGGRGGINLCWYS